MKQESSDSICLSAIKLSWTSSQDLSFRSFILLLFSCSLQKSLWLQTLLQDMGVRIYLPFPDHSFISHTLCGRPMQSLIENRCSSNTCKAASSVWSYSTMCVHIDVQSDTKKQLIDTLVTNTTAVIILTNTDTERGLVAVKNISYIRALSFNHVCVWGLQLLLRFRVIRSLIYELQSHSAVVRSLQCGSAGLGITGHQQHQHRPLHIL